MKFRDSTTGELFPVGGETMVRRSDPETSHEAKEGMKESGRLAATQERCLNAVRAYPGNTMRELCDEQMDGVDLRTHTTRFSELRRKGFIYYSIDREEIPNKRPCRITGKNCITIWPKEADDGR